MKIIPVFQKFVNSEISIPVTTNNNQYCYAY